MQQIDIKGMVLDANSGQLFTMLGMQNTNPQSIQHQLESADGDDIELSIASDGGDVFAASEIYTMLKQYPGKVSGTVQGLAASAASVIAEACDHLVISPAGQMMIHKASENVTGNADDLMHESNVLNGIDQTLASIYENKTGKSQDEIIDLMKTETWLTAKQAVEQGFADEILDVQSQKKLPQVVNAIGSIPSKEAVANILKLVKDSTQNKKTNDISKEELSKTDSQRALFARKLAILKGE